MNNQFTNTYDYYKNQPLTIAKASKLIATIQAKKQAKADEQEPSAEPISITDIPF